MKKIRYGNTCTYLIPGTAGGLLIDTDYAGTLQGFFRAIKAAGTEIKDIRYLIATHYHPDHMGIAGELQKLGITLVILGVQLKHVHFPDAIFSRERHSGYVPVDENAAKVITFTDSRAFFESIGIAGEIVCTPSHSPDCISVVLDDGDCFVGDLERYEYLESYGDNAPLKKDWDLILSKHPKRIFFSHSPEMILKGNEMEGSYRFIDLRQMPELEDKAAGWFSSKWSVPKEAYLECMDSYLDGSTEYGWYLCLSEGDIVGGLGVIENDFHDRRDLTPNICAVYTEEAHRKKGIAGKLLNMAVEDLRSKGISPVYLLTDHTGFYERYGWEFFCMAQGDGEDRMSRMYIHR